MNWLRIFYSGAIKLILPLFIVEGLNIVYYCRPRANSKKCLNTQSWDFFSILTAFRSQATHVGLK